MFTVIETPLFQSRRSAYWSKEEFGAFAAFIASNPTAGDVVPNTGGVRKVRWQRRGKGKSGSVRVVYFTRNAVGEIVLLSLYVKSATANLSPAILKELRRVYK
jgi:hypothetical protein